MKINLINEKGWFIGQTNRPIDPVATANAGEDVYADVNPQSGTLLALPLFDVATQLPVLINDAWVVHPSYLTVNLYRTDNGEKFILGDVFDGVGDLPSWLTLSARPSEAYDWNGTKWVLNKTKQAQMDVHASQDALNAVKQALQSYIDEVAKGLGFSNGNAVILYAGFTNPFRSLAQQFGVWEASIWASAGAVKQMVEAGQMSMPTVADAISQIPPFELIS